MNSRYSKRTFTKSYAFIRKDRKILPAYISNTYLSALAATREGSFSSITLASVATSSSTCTKPRKIYNLSSKRTGEIANELYALRNIKYIEK